MMHDNTLMLFEKHAKPLFKSDMRVLEIGPNGFPTPFEKIVADKSIRWETLDMVSVPGLTHLARGEYDFALEENSFDVVCSGNVIEHVKKIWLWMREIARVTRRGGFVITIGPVSWPFHEAPVDCWRIYPDGMRALYEDAGLRPTLALYDSMQKPFYEPSGYYLLKQGIKKMIGKKPWLPWTVWPVVDTIAVAVKE